MLASSPYCVSVLFSPVCCCVMYATCDQAMDRETKVNVLHAYSFGAQLFIA